VSCIMYLSTVASKNPSKHVAMQPTTQATQCLSWAQVAPLGFWLPFIIPLMAGLSIRLSC
jgi:hypothetical protein